MLDARAGRALLEEGLERLRLVPGRVDEIEPRNFQRVVARQLLVDRALDEGERNEQNLRQADRRDERRREALGAADIGLREAQPRVARMGQGARRPRDQSGDPAQQQHGHDGGRAIGGGEF